MSSEHEEIEQEPEEPTPQETAEVQEEEPPPKPKKPHYGGRKANPDKEDLTDKTECDDCNKTISKHAKKYTHRCPAKKKDASRSSRDVVIEAIDEVAQAEPETAPAPKAKAAPKRAPKETATAPAAPPRRLLDLDHPIDHNDPNIHHIVNTYVRSIKEHQNIAKRDKYKSMLAGRI
jgi:hypothetical protein